MSILKEIENYKRQIEIPRRKTETNIKDLEQSSLFQRQVFSLKNALQQPDASGIIAEFKRHSPSKGDINITAKVEDVTKGYVETGASGLSVLTDEKYFKGTIQDLLTARKTVNAPILRKDFIVDEFQILEAKAMGADVILLIAECLTKQEVKHLAAFAKSLGLEVLMEIHTEIELLKLSYDLDLVGVNNRNLKTFEVNVDTSVKLFDKIPSDFVRISESGISHPNTILKLKEVGFQGFLMGEVFMKTRKPEETCQRTVEFIRLGKQQY